MKSVLAAMILSLSTSIAFATETLSPEIRDLVADRISTKLSEMIQLDSNLNLAQVDPATTNMDIQSSNKVNGEVVSMVILAEGVTESYDYDFGDTVNEYEFKCKTKIVKNENQDPKWTVKTIKCEYSEM